MEADLRIVTDADRREVFASPGPTRLPPRVLEAVSRPILHHRATQFRSALRTVRDGVQRLANTDDPVLFLACTGTGVMESAVVNLCGPGDTVLVVAAGYFGERWVELAETYGCDVVPLRYPWGAVPSADELQSALAAHPDAKVVFVVHSETSTGVVVDLEGIGAACTSAGVLLVVDAVSSFAATPIETAAWGVDVLVTSSHKALMTPPGLGILVLSDAARRASARAPVRRFYLDWERNLAPQLAAEPETWFSPAITLVVALEAALACIDEEGIDMVFERHVRLARRCRTRVKALGLELFSPDDDSAVPLTAVRMPSGVDSTTVVATMNSRWGVTIADGEARLKGSIVRIGHLGYVSEDDVDRAVAALGKAVDAVGGESRPRSGTTRG